MAISLSFRYMITQSLIICAVFSALKAAEPLSIYAFQSLRVMYFRHAAYVMKIFGPVTSMAYPPLQTDVRNGSMHMGCMCVPLLVGGLGYARGEGFSV